MSQLSRIARFWRWARTVPDQLQSIHEAVTVSPAQVVTQQMMTDQIVTPMAEIHSAVEASSKAQLEAIRFLTRSINELSVRLAKLESAGEDKAG